jgi:hypothetical protein
MRGANIPGCASSLTVAENLRRRLGRGGGIGGALPVIRNAHF